MNPNPPAFPRNGYIDTSNGSLPDGDMVVGHHNGMSLRDYFAAAALTGMLSHIQAIPQKCIEVSFEIADAMLKARE